MRMPLLIAAAALAAAGAAHAQTATSNTQTSTKVDRPALSNQATETVHKTTTTTAPDHSGHMVATKKHTGAKVTYDCSKPENKAKAGCTK